MANHESVFTQIGASNHTQKKREENDFYSTDPRTIANLLEHVRFISGIWEPCCGLGCLSIPLIESGESVYSSDLYDHGYGVNGIDFFQQTSMPKGCRNIVTNPPYKHTTDFITHALSLLPEGGILALFLKTQYLEGIERYERVYKKTPPIYILQYINRVSCKTNARVGDDFGTSAVAYAWYIWQKSSNLNLETKIRWVKLG